MRKSIQAVFLTGFILAILSHTCLALPVGSKAPDFALKNIEGETVRLSDYKGSIVLLKIGSTQCPTCMEELGEIRAIGDFLKAKDVVFLDVFLRDSEEKIRKAIGDEDLPMTTESLVGDMKVYKAYNVYTIPRVLLIDRDQKVVRDGSIWMADDIKKAVEDLCTSSSKAEKE